MNPCRSLPNSIQNTRFDAHAHLPESENFCFSENWRGVVCAVCENEFEALASLSEKYAGLIPAFGLHPWFLKGRSANHLGYIRRFLEKIPRAQVGEIGLDKARIDTVSLKEQENVFCGQLRLAAELKRPANIHCVRAWNVMMTILRREKDLPKMHFHAFSGSPEIARELMKTADVGFSFSPRQLQSPSEKICRILDSVPPERLFDESDAPIGKISEMGFPEARQKSSKHQTYDLQ